MADISRLMKVATKPDRREIWLLIRVTALGMAGLGLLGFLIKLVGNVVFSAKTPSTATSAPVSTGLIIQLVHMLMVIL